MQNFPRLTKVFGAPVTELNAEAIDRAITAQVPEAADLDWKSVLYRTDDKGKRELAKDVIALANGVGGVLVLGVRERDSCASEAAPVDISDGIRDRMEQVCRSLIYPFLPGVVIRPLDTGGGRGFYIIIVARSAEAPHAVVTGGERPTLQYAVRAGSTTRYLHEAEIAARYRDRFISRADRTASMNRVHTDGLDRLPSQDPWIVLSIFPAVAGDLGVGSKAVSAVDGLVNTWMSRTSPPVETFQSHSRTVPGVRRAIINPEVGFTSTSSQPHAQLHFNGAGFVALPHRRPEPAYTPDPVVRNADKLMQDYLELQIFALVLLLAHHAANSGSTGDCALKAQLVLATRTDDPTKLTISPTAGFAPARQADGGAFDHHEHVPGSLILRRNPAPTEIEATLDELTADPRAVVISAYSLACDLLGELGIAEPCVLRPDGYLATDRIVGSLRLDIDEWAARSSL
ncbi:RNA-binding domain-containing protein [Nocardia salmonicida]|uniref:AlbA family DNA-binding domain-containing protein n=1 Tax=Nocardia salmonicida TaxID=53431 RepID=UPI003444E2D4